MNDRARLTILGIALSLGMGSGLTSAQQGPLLPGLAQRHGLDDEPQVGRVLLTELRCVACHAVPAGHSWDSPPPAPDLSDVGRRVDPDYLSRFLSAPHASQPGTRMPDVLGARDESERTEIARSLAAFLSSRASEPFERTAIDAQAVSAGRELFHTIGCVACHSPRDPSLIGPAPTVDHAVNLEHVAAKYSSTSLAEFLHEPHRVRPAGRMPDMKLTRAEARSLAHYLIAATESPAAAPSAPDPAAVDRGRQWFSQLRCNACHELDDVPPAPPATPLQEADLDRGCLSEAPSKPASYNLTDTQRSALRAAIADLEAPLTEAGRIAHTLTVFNCIACHERDETGGVHPDLDPYFRSEQHDLGNEARIPPTLTLAGAKLRTEWMQQVLFDGASVRPYMDTRMPQFGEEHLSELPALFAAVDHLPPLEIPEPPQKQRGPVRDAGRQLLGTEGLSCITCHNFNTLPSPVSQGIDLLTTFERLQPSWYSAYLKSPQSFRPGTVMPDYWPDGEAANPTILDGDVDAQIAAMWYVFSLGRSAPTPKGLRNPGTKLRVDDRVVTYRGRANNVAGFRGIAVGHPGGWNFAFNAQNGCLCAVWRGEFVNVRWSGQGAGGFSPIPRSISWSQDVGFCQLENDRSPWPARPRTTKENPVNPDPAYPRQHGYRFRGYSLGDNDVPTFRYQCGDVQIQDTSLVQGDRLSRLLVLDTPNATQLYAKVLSGQIERRGDREFAIAGLTLTTNGGTPLIRDLPVEPDQQPQRELLLKLPLAAGTTAVSLEYSTDRRSP